MSDPATVREWARANGHDVAAVGRVPEDLVVAYEQRDVRPDFVPLERHRKAARRIAETSRRHGAIEVLREVEDLLYDDVPLVMVALARLTWTPECRHDCAGRRGCGSSGGQAETSPQSCGGRTTRDGRAGLSMGSAVGQKRSPSDVEEQRVQRRINGDRQVSITKAERIEIVRRCRAAGWSYTDIERITGVTKVYRYIEREAS